MVKTFDVGCYDLASRFLEANAAEHRINDLALTIQTAIEDWIDDHEVKQKCEFCGASLFRPCRSQQDRDRCELPPFAAADQP
jgi:hypothetical protein